MYLCDLMQIHNITLMCCRAYLIILSEASSVTSAPDVGGKKIKKSQIVLHTEQSCWVAKACTSASSFLLAQTQKGGREPCYKAQGWRCCGTSLRIRHHLHCRYQHVKAARNISDLVAVGENPVSVWGHIEDSRLQLLKLLKVRLVCKRFDSLYAEQVLRLSIPAHLSIQALPGLLSWLTKSKFSLKTFEANCNSQLVIALLGALAALQTPLAYVRINNIAQPSIQLLSAFKTLNTCALDSSTNDDDTWSLSSLGQLPCLQYLQLVGRFIGLGGPSPSDNANAWWRRCGKCSRLQFCLISEGARPEQQQTARIAWANLICLLKPHKAIFGLAFGVRRQSAAFIKSVSIASSKFLLDQTYFVGPRRWNPWLDRPALAFSDDANQEPEIDIHKMWWRHTWQATHAFSSHKSWTEKPRKQFDGPAPRLHMDCSWHPLGVLQSLFISDCELHCTPHSATSLLQLDCLKFLSLHGVTCAQDSLFTVAALLGRFDMKPKVNLSVPGESKLSQLWRQQNCLVLETWSKQSMC